jgi:TatD DNase family protein
MLVDTHCHIHEASYPLEVDAVRQRAHEAGVDQLICVGTNLQSSREALAFASVYSDAYAAIGIHPHDTKEGWQELGLLVAEPQSKLVAIGEIGLDYFYTHSPREVQIEALEAQLNLALKLNVPVIFHVREAFDDFWPIFDNFHGIRGELHSFTDTQQTLDQALERGLFIGVNGISTFTRDESQKVMFANIPLDRMLLETDAPFLTPSPLRGKVNEPAFVKQVAEHHARIRGLSFDDIAISTSSNAHALFAL